MRFSDLEGLTTLPIEQLRDRFRNEEVLTVLPVTIGSSSRDSLLVATPAMLAILVGEAEADAGWMTRWAPWDGVHFADIDTTDDDDAYSLTVLVDRVRFRAELHGELGRHGLRDFVVAVQTCQATVVAT